MRPNEFWTLHPEALWWWFEQVMGIQMVGKMTMEEADELIDFMKERGIT